MNDDATYFLEIPDPPGDAPYAQRMAHAALISLMLHAPSSSRVSGVVRWTPKSKRSEIPEFLEEAMKAYLARWYPSWRNS
jgi:hypothetical protein